MTEEDNAMNTEVDTVDNVGDNVGEHLGQVKWFNKKKGFGFIKNVNNPTSDDVFFHFSDIQSVGYKILFPGEFVSMDIMQNNERDICRNIRGVGGMPLLTDNEKYHFRVIPKHDNTVNQ
jgi:CspA family cold shock protein